MEPIHEILLQAIKGETSAEAGYRKHRSVAQSEGYENVAALFEALSRAEAIHIANHTRALEKNGFTASLPHFSVSDTTSDTLTHLQKSVASEYDEFKEMYPAFRRKIGKLYKNSFPSKIALLSIKWACESEQQHHRLLKEALAAVKSGRDVSGGHYYLCTVCGNIHFSAARPEELCQVCGHDISFYSRIGEEA